MKKILITALMLAGISATAQVKIGDNPTVLDPGGSTLLEMESTSKGLLISRMTTAQRTAIATPANGLQVFDTDTKSFWYFDATILPAPGAWVEGSSKGNEEWVYNGTDAIEAKRAKDNNQIVRLYNNGARFEKTDDFDTSTLLNGSNGTDLFFATDPALTPFANSVYKTSKALNYVSPFYSANLSAPYVFNHYYNTVKDDHINNNPNTTSKRYFGLNVDNYVDQSATADVGDIYGIGAVGAVHKNATSNFNNLFAFRSIADHYGNGNVSGSVIGADIYSRIWGSGTYTNIYGARISANSFTGATGNGTNLFGLSLAASHARTGSLADLRGISANTTVSATGSVPSSTRGAYVTLTNNSTTVGAGTANGYGISTVVTNNTVTKFASLRAIDGVITVAAAAAPPTNAYGMVLNATNNSTSTDAITGWYGIQNITQSLGNSNVGTIRGLYNVTQTGTTATAGIANNLVGMYNTVLSRTLQAGTASALYGFQQIANNAGAANYANHIGFDLTTNHSGAGYTTTNYRGINNNMTNSSTGTGTTVGWIGIQSGMTHNSTTNAIQNITNTNGLFTNNGKIATNGIVHGAYFGITNNSTQGNTILSIQAVSFVNNTTNLSNDATAQSFGIANRNDFSSSGLATMQRGITSSNRNYSTNTGTMTQMTGLYSENHVYGASNITDNYGGYLYNAVNTEATGTITNNYGLRVNSVKSGASPAVITNSYGIYVDNPATSTANNFAIYTAGGNSVLAGSLQMRGGNIELNATNSSLQHNARFVSGTGWTAIEAGKTSYVFQNNDTSSQTNLLVSPTAAAAGDLLANYVSLSMNNNNGNVTVGAGVNNTVAKLDVRGYVKVGSTDASGDATPTAGLVRYNSGLQYHDGTAWVTVAGTSGASAADTTVDAWVENAGNTVVSTGNVGIGTATPTEKLDVTGSIKMVDGNQAVGAFMVSDAAGKATWTAAATALGAASSKWTNDATNTRVALTNLSDGTTARTAGTEFVVTDAGRVGIGTATPTAKLSVLSNNSAESRIIIANNALPATANTSSLDLKVMTEVQDRSALIINGSFANTIDATRTSSVSFRTSENGVSSISMSMLGHKIGIGTTAPTSKLQVVGLPGYASDTAAGAGGLTAGAFYQTLGHATLPNGVIMVKQ